MTRTVSRVLLMGIVGCAAGRASFAQTGSQLKLVVIVSRHGVRSPTWTQERLDSYSALPWPRWNVPPGNLTARGHRLMKLFGSFDRASLTKAGLFTGSGCADAGAAYLWADTDQRTIESGQALAEGLFPGCAPPLHSLAEGENDPLFHPAAKGVGPVQAVEALAQMTERLKREPEAQNSNFIREVQHVLLGCEPAAACTPVHAPKALLSRDAMAAAPGKGDHIIDLIGPLAQASTFVEDFLLEYADGMPMPQVGWGHVDERQLGRLLALHTDYFDLVHRTPAMAKIEASNMLSHIVSTLEQGVLREPVAGAIGPANSKLVMLVGHDTNLAGIAALLGVHWHLDGRDDDTPPGTEMRFELWRSAAGAYEVRVAVGLQTLRQLHEMPELTLAAPPAHELLALPGCAEPQRACGWQVFQRLAHAAIDTSNVFPMQIR